MLFRKFDSKAFGPPRPHGRRCRYDGSPTPRDVAVGRVESPDVYLVEAARRSAEDLDAEDEIVAEAEAGIADAEAGRYVTIATPEDAEALHERTSVRWRACATG